MPELLRAEGVRKQYGGVYALNGAGLSVGEGEVHALIGENGAGKSTLAKILAGSVRPDAGSILLGGEPVSIRHPLDAQRLGIAMIYQELDLFPNLTVGENIVIANLRFPEARLVNYRKIDDFARPFLERVGFPRGPREPVASLSIGQAQLVALARALSMEARIILMDEPTSSLGDDAAERLFQAIGDLKRAGVAIVYVSHKMDEIFRVCDRATVLRDGETAGTAEIARTTSEALIRMMVGEKFRKPERPAATPQTPARAPLLSVSGLTTRKLHNVSFELHAGEVLGIAGLVGAGRSELGAALFGLDRIRAGEIRLRGALLRPGSPGGAIRAGIGLLPEDRKLQGLMMDMSVVENSTLAVVLRMRRFGMIARERESDAMGALVPRLSLKCQSWNAPVSALSGGNQQKALLARWLLANPDVLFLDDPARGIDIAAKQDIYRIIAELAAAGKGIILASSELPELLRCSDRILVLSEGRVTARLGVAEATQERIMAAATNAAEASL